MVHNRKNRLLRKLYFSFSFTLDFSMALHICFASIDLAHFYPTSLYLVNETFHFHFLGAMVKAMPANYWTQFKNYPGAERLVISDFWKVLKK